MHGKTNKPDALVTIIANIPSFSRQTTQRDLSEQVVNQMMRELPAPKTSIRNNSLDNGLCIIILI